MAENEEELVIRNLKETDPTDAQIIDMLLMLLDKWVVREAVMRCVQRRRRSDGGDKSMDMVQTSTARSGS